MSRTAAMKAHRHSVALLLAAVLPVAAFGQSSVREPWAQVRPEAIEAHVRFLADDLLEGRAAGSRGYDTAAAYVAAQFRQYGLEAAGDNGTYFQTVPLLEATAVLPGSAARLEREDEPVEFEYGTDYLPGADFLSTSSTVTAPLVFAGFGIEAPELEYNDFANIDVSGKIAVIFAGAPARFAHNQRAYYSWDIEKYRQLATRGAVGIVVLDMREDAARYPWERRVASSWIPQMRWLDAEGQPMDVFPQLKLRFRFNMPAAARLFEGSEATLEQALDTAEAGTAQGFDLPGTLTLSATTGLRRTQSTNVVGVIEGSDPRLRNEYIVVTGHLDHLGRGAPVNGDSIYNGAHDNASGIGMLLEAARALMASDVRPRRSIVFAAVTAEERGLLGSDYFAHHPSTGEGRIVANVNLDMPMILGPTLDFVAHGAEHSSLGPVARRAARAQGYRLSPDSMPEEVIFIRSDQFSFVRQGIPSLYLNGGYVPRRRDIDVVALQREFLDTHYHEPSDDLSLPLDYPTAADLARVSTRILLEIANANARPSWNRGDFFAEKFPTP